MLEKQHWMHFSISLGFLFFCFYTIAWIFIYRDLQREVDEFVIDARDSGLFFEKGKPVISGYPAAPVIKFSGDLNYNGLRVVVPEFKMSGYFIPGTPLKVKFPYGLAAAEPFNPSIFSLDKLLITLDTPKLWPNEYYQEDLEIWRRRVGAFKIHSIKIEKSRLKVNAKGFIGLDDNLQPRGQLETKTRGHQEFIALLQGNGFLTEGNAAMASVVLKGLSEEDPVTKDQVVSMTISLENQLLSLGPLQVARLPVFDWGTRRSPVLLQR